MKGFKTKTESAKLSTRTVMQNKPGLPLSRPLWCDVRPLLVGFFIFFLGMATAGNGWAAKTQLDDNKTHWAADQITYDPDSETVTAQGHVEVRYEGNTLFADEVSYDRKADQATALGNIRFVDRNGDVVTTDKLVLTGDLRDGVIEGIQIFFKKGERLAAERGERKDGRWVTVFHAVFTPCKVCDEDGNDVSPLWQIKGKSVVHDQEKHTLTYDDAFLELLGIPVFYTPWLQHPDATVDKASGFLTPKLDSSSILGLSLELPYFWNIAPNKDLTVSPKITTDEGVILGAEYRHRVQRGTFSFSGSITNPGRRDAQSQKIDGNEIRGHIFGEGRFNINNSWDWGFDLALASDDTYLRRYDISRADSLTNRIFIENLSGRSSFSVNAYGFQGLRKEDDNGEIPIVLPFIEYNFEGKPGWLGGRFGADTSLVMLTRTDGEDTIRLSAGGNWQLPYISPFGEIYRLTVGFRGDLYRLSDITPLPADELDGPPTKETTGRILPYAMLEWRLPFIKRGNTSRQIVEPIVSIITSPTGGNPDGIPNEDSLSFDFDTSNLFSLSRYSGRDRWEGGTRVNYALKATHYADSGAQASLMVGQSYRLQRDDNFSEDSGLRDKLSDLVIGAQINLPGLFDYYHRLRLDKDSFKLVRNEGFIIFGPEDYRVSLGYSDVRRAEYGSSLPDRKEIRTAADIKLAQYWRMFADFSYDFEPQGGALTAGGGFTYEDECLKFQIRARRDFTSDRDVLPNTSIGFRLIFKVVGG
jgi:LPS-assembly protein